MDKRGRRARSDDLAVDDWQLLRLLREGLSHTKIAKRLNVSEDDVGRRVSEIESRLGPTGGATGVAPSRRAEGARLQRLSLPQPLRLRTRVSRRALALGGVGTLVVAGVAGTLVWALLAERGERLGYPSSPDAIVIQVKTTSYATWDPWLAERLNLPQLTLYGDGTLIFRQKGELGFDPQPMRTRVRGDTIRDLLQFMVDEGFMAFDGKQPRPQGLLRPTTHVYAQTSEAANAVSAYALDSELPLDAGEEWAQFWRLQLIVERLHDAVRTAALDSSLTEEFAPDALLLIVEPCDTPVKGSSTEYWPFRDIDLAQIAPPGSGRVEHHIEGDLGYSRWMFRGTMSQMSMKYGDRFFDVYARPLLPFEENFPVFDEP
jgi:hypothetical protein